MESKAIGKYLGVSVKKARIPVDIVRGMNVQEALNILKYMRKGAALPIRKVVQSAYANAINNYQMAPASLYISEIKVDQGPSQSRIIFKGKGGYAFFSRPTSHITVILKDVNENKVKSSKTKAVKLEKPAKEAKKEEKSSIEKSIKPVAAKKPKVKKKSE